MSKLRLHGTSSGYTDIAPTAAAGNNTLTAPTGTGTIVIEDASGDITIGRSIIHTGDTNTKINFSAADEITVETGGTEALKVRTDQRVQVTSGSAEVIGTEGASAQLRLTADEGDDGADYWRFESNHSTNKLNIASFISGAWVDKIVVDTSGNINATGVVTATSFVPTTYPYGTKNLIVNGAMMVAQRGTSSTTSGYGSLDNWNVTMGNTDEAFTHSQIELSSSDTGPWAEGFHNAMRIQNGNQTSGWQANSHGILHQHIEDRYVAQSGWQIESPSSYITVSYWIRSSVAQAFGGHIETYDGTDKTWMWSTGTLSANTWTKITKTIGGDSALSMSNDIGRGLQIQPWFIWGTNYTASDATLNAWASYNGSKRFTDMTSTWWTTNDATVDITGVQIEVGKAATPFEHRDYGDELARCQRYVYVAANGASKTLGLATMYQSDHMFGQVIFPVTMRTTPTLSASSGTNYYEFIRNGAADWFNSLSLDNRTTNKIAEIYNDTEVSGTVGHSGWIRTDNSAVKVVFSAEL